MPINTIVETAKYQKRLRIVFGVIILLAACLASWLTYLAYLNSSTSPATIALCVVIIPNCVYNVLKR